MRIHVLKCCLYICWHWNADSTKT